MQLPDLVGNYENLGMEHLKMRKIERESKIKQPRFG
jgi:hypothetical protein